MARRYLVAPLPAPGDHPLPPDVVHHLIHVLRHGPGAVVTLFDGAGSEAEAILTAASRRGATARVGPAKTVHRGADRPIHIAVALPKGNRADWLIEHGTEVGVAAFHPVIADRSVSRRPDSGDRWRRIIAAAAGQCDRSHLPTLHPAVGLDAFFDRVAALPPHRYVADGDGPGLAAAPAAGAVLLVGPEGGFTGEELTAAATAGFSPRSLGPLTLRTETAALVGAARLLAP